MNEQTLIAQDYASEHGGDTVLHINPQEAALLKLMGGSGTTNPSQEPDFGFFKKLKRFLEDCYSGIDCYCRCCTAIDS